MSRHIRGAMRSAGLVGGLGFTLGLMTAAGAGVGYYLDQRWATVPWLTLAGTLCGMGAGFFEVVSVIRRLGDGATRGARRR